MGGVSNGYCLCIIGAGAAGLAAAVQAGQILRLPGSVALIDHGSRIGRKILASGNGRCNLSNLSASSWDYNQPDFVRPTLERVTPHAVLEWFSLLGLRTTTEGDRVYPFSNTASSVLDVLRLGLNRHQIALFTQTRVTQIKKQKRFHIALADGRVLTADRLLIAAGGQASPSLGADGSGYGLCRQLGHQVLPPRPALTGLKCPEKERKELHLPSLNGLRLKAKVTLVQGGAKLAQETGEILFRDYGLSGIAVFQLSRKGTVGTLSLDLFPEEDFPFLLSMLKERQKQFSSLLAEDFLTGLFHRQVARALLSCAGISLSIPVRNIPDGQLKALANRMKDWRFPVCESSGWQQAQITLGGLSVTEFHPETLESKLLPGFYAAGEVLDVDGPCGGYNLQWAWSSGIAAGSAAAQSLQK